MTPKDLLPSSFQDDKGQSLTNAKNNLLKVKKQIEKEDLYKLIKDDLNNAIESINKCIELNNRINPPD